MGIFTLFKDVMCRAVAKEAPLELGLPALSSGAAATKHKPTQAPKGNLKLSLSRGSVPQTEPLREAQFS